MSEFKKNPAAVLRQAHSRPVAVLNHNKAAFYMVEPQLFQALLDELADLEHGRMVAAGSATGPQDMGPARRAVIVRLLEKSSAMTPEPASRPDH